MKVRGGSAKPASRESMLVKTPAHGVRQARGARLPRFTNRALNGCVSGLLIVFGCFSICSAETLTDALGQQIRLDRPPRRIVSLSPNLTEILFAVGVNRDRIVGVTRFCDYPPQEVAGLARVGGIVDPSVERIISLHPDLVVATRGNPVPILDRLRSAGVEVYAFESQGGMDLVLRTMRTMASLVTPDRPEEADSAIAAFDAGLNCLRATSAGIAPKERPAIFYYDPASPDWTAGRGTHVSEAISLAGGRNVADQSDVAWPRYSVEAILAHPPDRILIAAGDGDTSRAATERILAGLRGRPGWRGLEAVRDGEVCLVAADWLLRPGPRLLLAIRAIGRCLHPELDWGCAR